MSNTNLTPERLKEYLDILPADLSYVKKRSIAKTLGCDLPAPKLSDQLQAISIVRNHVGKVTKKTPAPVPTDYISVPSLVLADGSGTTKGFWLRKSVARAVVDRMTEVLDAEDTK